MTLLLLDTCGVSGTVALADSTTGSILVSATLPGRSASERLLPAIQSLLASVHPAASNPLRSLGAIAVVHGPGSFTGIRIGVAAAKGLADALSIPVLAISRLAVLADQAMRTHHISPETPYPLIHTVLDAGRGEFYYGLHQANLCLRESLLPREEVLTAIAAHTNPALVAACEPIVAQSLALPGLLVLPEPTAQDALPLALRRLVHHDFDDITTLDANYVRRTDAEIFAKPKPPSSHPRP